MSRIVIRIACFLLVSFGPVFGQAISFLAPVVTKEGEGTIFPRSTSLAIGDFNHDGKLDIAFEPPTQDFVLGPVVLFGNGDGTFRTGPALSPPGEPFAADFNGDGITDILVGPPGRATVVLSNGDGTFRTPIAVPACSELHIIGDFNGDGKPDLICSNAVLLGNGDGTFQTPIPHSLAIGGNLLVVADFNHDGILDILDLQPSNALAVALGRGDGTFATETVAVAAAPRFQFGVTGDFNGDGIPDLAGICTEAGSICVLPGKGDGTFGPGIINHGLTGVPQAAADFNKDGKLDLVASDGSVLAGNGDGTFQVPVFIQPGFVAIADFNGDGQPDIIDSVASSAAGSNFALQSVLLNDSPGDGFYTTGVSSASWTWPVATGSITSAFGLNLAQQTGAASVTDGSFPTTLGGIRVHIRDSTGDSLAPLIYVSPTQINYVMTSSDTFAWIGIEHVGAPYIPKGIGLAPATAATGLFNTNGVAAANAVSVAPDGTQTPVPVISCSGTSCTAVPIDVSGNRVYLSLYGTGFDSVPMGVQCIGGSLSLPVAYAGPQKQIPGVDQINLQLPASLAGSGTVSITCYDPTQATATTTGNTSIPLGPPSNTVKIAVH